MIHLGLQVNPFEHTFTGDFDVFSKLAGLSFDLYAVMKKFLKVRAIEDTIGSRLGVINSELVLNSGSFGGGGLGLEIGVSLLRRELSKAVPRATDHG
jgi:hypothetical protein